MCVMKKENLVPKMDNGLRKEIVNEALDRGTKKVIIFWDKNDLVHYPRHIEENENINDIINQTNPVDVYVETIDIENSVKNYAFIGEECINYHKAWFKVEFPDEKIIEEIEAFVPS